MPADHPLPPLFHITEQLGAVQVDGDSATGRVQFRLFFSAGFDPQIREIRAAGSFQGQLGGTDWDFQGGPLLARSNRPEGEFWTLTLEPPLTAGFYEYKYLVTFTDRSERKVTDPYARYSGSDHQNSGFVIGGSRPEENVVTPLQERKPLRDLMIYELHPDDFTDEYRGVRAPFDAVQDRLDHLADLGINAILFMPWTSWRDKNYDWGYAPFQYFAVEYLYANDLNHPEEKLSWLKRLISACHARGIHVIMDGVFNHCSTDFPYKQLYRNEADCPYTAEPFGGSFPGLQDLDFNNDCTQAFVRDVCLYWISVFGIDGIRFDNTVNFYVAGDPRGLPELLESIQSYLDDHRGQNFSMTLEHLRLDAATLVNTTRATSYWDNALYGECFDQLLSYTLRPGYLAALNNTRFVNGPDKVATIYLGNHDHSSVAWRAGERDHAGSLEWYRTQPHAIALLTSPGTPLIANGQEFAEDYWLPEDDQGTGRRIKPRPLSWKRRDDRIGSALFGLYRKLCEIRRNHPSLRSLNFHPPVWEGWQTRLDQDGFGVDTEKQIVVYHRWGNGAGGALERFIIALNFSGQPQFATLQFPENGNWADLLSGGIVNITNFRLGFTLEPNWGHLFFR
jgi:pullulanase